MNALWLVLLPLLFLPNLGRGVSTPFGVLELSDFVIVPYVLALLFAARPRSDMRLSAAASCFGLFVGWALLSTLSMSWRYDDLADTQLTFGLLKVAKFALYGSAGLLTVSAVRTPEARRRFSWALLAAVFVLSVSLLVLQDNPSNDGQLGYKANNGISVLLAVLLSFLGGAYVKGLGTPGWRRALAVALPMVLVAFTVTEGRGGWVAGLAGGAYLMATVRLRTRTLGACAAAACLVVAAYAYLPVFANQVDRTLWPDQAELDRYGSGVAGIDDGGRVVIFVTQLPALLRSPLFGAGFFHRVYETTGLYRNGSHNFWLQMFLETGFPGGLLMLGFIAMMWRHAGDDLAGAMQLTHPVRAALVATFVGGLSGEYFYGGMGLFALVLVYVPVGSLPAYPVVLKPRSRSVHGRLSGQPVRAVARNRRTSAGVTTARV